MNARTLGLAALLTLIGCGQMLADVLQLPRLKAAMQLMQVSPAMKVFTAHRGYETYAARFYIERIDAGALQTIELDRARYQRYTGGPDPLAREADDLGAHRAGEAEVGVEAVESLVARGKRGLTAALMGRREELGFDDG